MYCRCTFTKFFKIFCRLQEKVEAGLIFGEAQYNYHAAERIFNERFPDRPITRKNLRKLVQNFRTTASILDAKKAGKPPLTREKKIK